MKRFSKILTISFILAFTTSLIASVYLESITAHSDGNYIFIEWKTGKENNVTHFVVERAEVNSQNYVPLAYIPPKGDNSYYTYKDENIFKSNNATSSSSDIYKYKLRIVCANEDDSFSQEVRVSHLSSVAKRTWGMIKAMFR